MQTTSLTSLKDGSLDGSKLHRFQDRILDCLGPRAQFMVLSGQEEAPLAVALSTEQKHLLPPLHMTSTEISLLMSVTSHRQELNGKRFNMHWHSRRACGLTSSLE